MRKHADETTKVTKGLAWRLRRQVALSRAALSWERAWPALMPALAVIGCYVMISLFDLWSLMAGWLHGLFLVGFLVALCAALWRSRDGFSLPDDDAAIRRLERDSDVDHRPLTATLDAPAVSGRDGGGGLLWRAHVRRMARLLDRLRVSWPAPALAARDPHAIGAVIVLLLVIGVAGAGGDAWSRVTAGLDPNFTHAVKTAPGQITAWIEQPDYTGLAPVFLTDVAGTVSVATQDGADALRPEAVIVVAGSRLLARVHGGEGTPIVTQGEEQTPFVVADATNFTFEMPLASNVELEASQGRRHLGSWQIVVVPDMLPEIGLGTAPEKTQNAVLRLTYEASDDFGLDRINARFDRGGTEDDADPIVLDLALPGFAPLEASESSYHDLTAHPWAGMPVVLTLVATDTAGQVSNPPVRFPMVLPHREFKHPMAMAIIEQRRRLALDNSLVLPVRKSLGNLLQYPDQMDENFIAYLGLRMAFARLRFVEGKDDLQSVFDLLWDVALSLEDGDLALAERVLREAQERLQEALASDIPPEELLDLIDDVRAAMENFLELMRENQENESALEDGGSETFEDENLSNVQNDLQQMLNEAEQLAMSGARDQAQQMLDQLQEMLENMTARPNSQSNANGGEPLMMDLEDIMNSQEELLDDTFEKAQASPDDAEPMQPRDDQAEADRQEQIRRKLGEVMRQIGERGADIPEAMGRAERKMRDARDDLAQGRPDRAVNPQAEALQLMQQGAEDLINQMATDQPNDQRGQGRQSRSADERRDPLGRMPPGEGRDPAGYVGVPKESDIQRSREILEELYKRAGERERPEAERDYIDRLLRWF